jgi:hypothetical protein
LILPIGQVRKWLSFASLLFFREVRVLLLGFLLGILVNATQWATISLSTPVCSGHFDCGWRVFHEYLMLLLLLLLLGIPHSGEVGATIVGSLGSMVVWVRPWLLLIFKSVSVVLYHIWTHLLLRSPNICTVSSSNHRCLPFESFIWLLILAASGSTVYNGMIIQTEWAIREHLLLLLLLISALGGLKLSKAAIGSLRVETWRDVWGWLQAFVEGLTRRGVLFVKHFNGAYYLNSNFINTILS